PPPLDAPDCGRRRPVRWRALPAARRRRRTRWDGWLVHPRPRLTGGTACAAPHRAAASGRPVVRAVLDPRLAAGAEWAQRRVHDEEPVAPGGALVAVAPPPPERGVGPLGLLEAGPPLPRRDGPEQEALGLVAHRRLPRSGEGPAVLLVQRHCGVGHVLEEVACLALLERELLLGVRLAAHAVRAQLFDGPGPRCGDEDAVGAAAAVVGGLGPPLRELRVLQGGVPELVAERRRQAV